MNLDKTLIILLIIALVVMGPSQLPKLAQMLGKSAKALREGMEGGDEDEAPAPKPASAPAPAPAPTSPAPAPAPTSPVTAAADPSLPDGDELS